MSINRLRIQAQTYDVEMVENEGEVRRHRWSYYLPHFQLSDDYTPTLKKRASSGKTAGREPSTTCDALCDTNIKGFYGCNNRLELLLTFLCG